MAKTIILNLSNVKMTGDVLDVGESYGVVYNLTKEIGGELAIDIIDESVSRKLNIEQYDLCTMFFCLSQFWTENKREFILKDIRELLKDKAEVYVWDINKERGEIFNNKIRVLLPSQKIKEFDFKNTNIFCKSNIDELKKSIKGLFNVKEEKVWEDIFFLKLEKI